MDMQNMAFIYALKVLINSQYASNMYANKQVNSENCSPKLKCYQAFFCFVN